MEKMKYAERVGVRRTIDLRIPLSPDEAKDLDEFWKAEGVVGMARSAFVREYILRAARKRREKESGKETGKK